MKNDEKTNVMRILEQKKLPYVPHCYKDSGAVAGVEVAAALRQDATRVFKTLVTVAEPNRYYVFIVPVAEELDLKKAAKAVGEKRVEMLKQKDLLPLTGYVHGGCSPIGMKKLFKTVAHITAETAETVFVSAGKIGWQIEIAPASLAKAIPLSFADVIKEHRI